MARIGKADSQLERPRQIVALVETLPRLGYDLSDILNETVFDSEAPAALGLLPPDDVLAHLSDLVRTSGSATLSKLLTSAKISQKTLEENGVARRSDPLEGVNKLDPTFHPGRGDQGAEASVPFKLETLRSHLASVTGHRSDHSDPYLRQKLLEESAYDAARQQYDHMQQMLKDNNVSSATAPTSVREYVWTWTQALAKRVSEHVDFDHKKPRIALDTFAANEQHFFAVLPPEQMAFTAVTVMLQLTSDEGPVHDGATSASACVMIGKAIEREYMAKTMSDLNPKGFEKQLKRTMEESQYGKGRDRALVKMWKDHQSKIEEEQEGVQSDVPKMTTTSFAVWTQSVRARVGAQLISWLLDAAKVTRTTTVTEVDEKGVLLDRVV